MRTPSHELGERIKRLRLAQNLTLKELEAKARVSATHLSEIERGLTSPTVGAVARIARALGEDPALLVREHTGARVAVTRAGARRVWASNGVAMESLGAPFDGAETSVVEITLAGGTTFEPALAPGEEFVLVLAGSVDLALGSTTHSLGEGDALHYAPVAARALRARTDARVLWVALPAAAW